MTKDREKLLLGLRSREFGQNYLVGLVIAYNLIQTTHGNRRSDTSRDSGVCAAIWELAGRGADGRAF